MRLLYPASILLACLLLAACGKDKSATTSTSAADESLPQPDAAAGSVTGMPNPGTPSVVPAPADNPATDNEVPELAVDNPIDADPTLPTSPPDVTLERRLGKPPADTMPVMPAHPPADPQELHVQPTPPPPES